MAQPGVVLHTEELPNWSDEQSRKISDFLHNVLLSHPSFSKNVWKYGLRESTYGSAIIIIRLKPHNEKKNPVEVNWRDISKIASNSICMEPDIWLHDVVIENEVGCDGGEAQTEIHWYLRKTGLEPPPLTKWIPLSDSRIAVTDETLSKEESHVKGVCKTLHSHFLTNPALLKDCSRFTDYGTSCSLRLSAFRTLSYRFVCNSLLDACQSRIVSISSCECSLNIGIDRSTEGGPLYMLWRMRPAPVPTGKRKRTGNEYSIGRLFGLSPRSMHVVTSPAPIKLIEFERK